MRSWNTYRDIKCLGGVRENDGHDEGLVLEGLLGALLRLFLFCCAIDIGGRRLGLGNLGDGVTYWERKLVLAMMWTTAAVTVTAAALAHSIYIYIYVYIYIYAKGRQAGRQVGG